MGLPKLTMIHKPVVNWDKWGISLWDNITDNITSPFYRRKITINDLNYKLNAQDHIIVLSDFYIHNMNANGYYNNATSKYVVHTNKGYTEFTITGMYKLNF